jgi:hypothetical protein
MRAHIALPRPALPHRIARTRAAPKVVGALAAVLAALSGCAGAGEAVRQERPDADARATGAGDASARMLDASPATVDGGATEDRPDAWRGEAVAPAGSGRLDLGAPAAPTAGAPCATDGDCAAVRWPGATCVPWPGGYCAAPCDDDGACEEGVCARRGDGAGRCLQACARDADCRRAYRCVHDAEWGTCQPRDRSEGE